MDPIALPPIVLVSQSNNLAKLTFILNPDRPENIAIDVCWIRDPNPEDIEEAQYMVEEIMGENCGGVKSFYDTSKTQDNQTRADDMERFLKTGKYPNEA